MTWQPVQPPREEEYLGEISLGLHTIESFDQDAPKKYEARVQDFQEMTFDRLDVEHTAPPEAKVGPAALEASPAASPALEAPAPIAAAPEVETPESAAPAASVAPVAPANPDPAVFNWTELPRSPLPRAESPGPPKVVQNKSAFETWLTRLKGGSG